MLNAPQRVKHSSRLDGCLLAFGPTGATPPAFGTPLDNEQAGGPFEPRAGEGRMARWPSAQRREHARRLVPAYMQLTVTLCECDPKPGASVTDDTTATASPALRCARSAGLRVTEWSCVAAPMML